MEKYEKRLIINQGLGEREEQIQRFNKVDWGGGGDNSCDLGTAE